MGLLTRTERQKLQSLLLSILDIDDAATGNVLMTDLPPALRRTISRSSSTTIDIANIINGADAWELPAGEEPPIYIVIENALGLVPGTQLAVDLQKLLDELKQRTGSASSASATPSAAAQATPSGAGTLRLRDPLRLSGAERRALLNALVAAFPNISDLRQMVLFELGQNLAQIAGLGDLNSTVFDLLTWAESHGQMAALIQGAWNTNSGNPALRDFVRQIRVS